MRLPQTSLEGFAALIVEHGADGTRAGLIELWSANVGGGDYAP